MTRPLHDFVPRVFINEIPYFVEATGNLRAGTPAEPSLGDKPRPPLSPPWAVRVKLYRSPTQRERHIIDDRTHTLAGGLEKWIDIQRGIAARREALRRLVINHVFPDGIPPDAGAEGVDEKLRIYLRTFDHAQADALAELVAMAERLRFWAEWPTLIHRVELVSDLGDSPDSLAGWEDIAEMPMAPGAFNAVWHTHSATVERAEAAVGKAEPSAS